MHVSVRLLERIMRTSMLASRLGLIRYNLCFPDLSCSNHVTLFRKEKIITTTSGERSIDIELQASLTLSSLLAADMQLNCAYTRKRQAVIQAVCKCEVNNLLPVCSSTRDSCALLRAEMISDKKLKLTPGDGNVFAL